MPTIEKLLRLGLAATAIFTCGCQSFRAAVPLASEPASSAPAMAAAAAFSKPAPSLPEIPERSFSVKDFGAVGDGVADDTAAIQKALDAVRDAGGGTVVFPSGTFLSGPLDLSARTRVSLTRKAVLRMLPMDLYPAHTVRASDSGKESVQYRPLICAKGIADVSIEGPGLIDGQGRPWWEKFRAKQLPGRPVLIGTDRVERLSVIDLRLKDSPMMHITANTVKDLTVDGVTIDTPSDAPNSDGVNFKGENVVIKNCSISTGDDNIAFKGPSSNIRIFDCRFGHGHGVSMGSYTRGGISDVAVDNCVFKNTKHGLRGKSSRKRGGLVQNVSYSNIVMREVRTPILFTSYYIEKMNAPGGDRAQPVDDLTPQWKNVAFKNIESKTTKEEGNVAILFGLPEAPIEDFAFENVRLKGSKTFKIYYARNIAFSSNSSVAATAEPAFALFDASVRTPDGKTLSAGNKIEKFGGRAKR